MLYKKLFSCRIDTVKNARTLVKNILDHLNSFAPPKLAEKWDHVGLQVGRSNCKVTGALVALDATQCTLHEAIQKKLNLIITHHPLLPSKLTQNLKAMARKHQINILSFHTNLDSTSGGLNDLLARQIGLLHTKPLIPHPRHKRLGLGRVGVLPHALTLHALLKKLGKVLPLSYLRFVGEKSAPIKRVAVMTGSGGGYFKEALQHRADVLVTGDVKYHAALDALQSGICMIDIGHYPSEIGMTQLVSALLKQRFPDLKILIAQNHQDPFKIMVF